MYNANLLPLFLSLYWRRYIYLFDVIKHHKNYKYLKPVRDLKIYPVLSRYFDAFCFSLKVRNGNQRLRQFHR